MDNVEPSPVSKILRDMESELNYHKKRNLDMEHEASSLKNSIRQAEARYALADAAPPKVAKFRGSSDFA